MKNILKYLSALCPCPLSADLFFSALVLCRSFLPILKSTQPWFWGLLQALSCPSHPQRVVPMGWSLPAPLWWVFHCQVSVLGPSCCQVTFCLWSSFLCRLRNPHLLRTEPCPPHLCLLDRGNWETTWHRTTAKAGADVDGSCLLPAQPSLLLVCSWRVPPVLERKALHGRSVLQDCK